MAQSKNSKTAKNWRDKVAQKGWQSYDKSQFTANEYQVS